MTESDDTTRDDPSPQALQAGRDPEEVEEQAPTPFDHPLFLPELLGGLTLWFGYDGWINQDPEMLEHLSFNRWGFGVLVLAGTYYTVQSLREARAEREGGSSAE